MAFLAESEKDKEEMQPGAQAQGQGQQMGGQGGVIGQGAGGQPGAQATPSNMAAPQAGGKRYTNLQSYLQANQEQAGSMAGKVVGGIESQANEGQQGLQQVQSKFNEQAKAPSFDAGLVSSVKQGEGIDQAKSVLGASYSGPRSLADADQQGYNKAASAIEQAGAKAQGLNTSEGLRSSLASTYQRPSYSRGQQLLDTGIVSMSDPSRAQLQATQEKYKGLKESLQSADQAAQNKALEQQKNLADYQKSLKDAANEGYSALGSNITNRLAEQNKQRADYQNQIQGILGKQAYQRTPEEWAALNALEKRTGIAADYGNQNGFVKFGGQLQGGDIASEQEAQKYRGLASLLGNADTGLLARSSGPTDDLIIDKQAFAADQANRFAQAKTQKDLALQKKADEAQLARDKKAQTLKEYMEAQAAADKESASWMLPKEVARPKELGKPVTGKASSKGSLSKKEQEENPIGMW